MTSDYLVWGLTVIDILVALGYAFQEDFARAVYWVAAAVLTGSTLFMGR